MSYQPVRTAPPAPTATTSPAAVHLQLYRQPGLAGVLDALAHAGRSLGAPSFIGCLLRDPGSDAWYVTALLDPAARPAALERLGVPAGPFPFTPELVLQARPLTGVLGAAWGEDCCVEAERRLGTVAALCLPFGRAEEPLGALVALLPRPEHAALLLDVLAHAATAAARHLDQEARSQAEGILDWRALAATAENEVARARRYNREVAVIVVEVESTAELVRVGTLLLRDLRPWDRVGRLDGGRPALAVVLPETGRDGARGLLNRLREAGALAGLRTAAAVVPADGAGFAQAVEFARGRTAVGAAQQDGAMVPAPAAGGRQVWVRGAPVGPGAETVRCERCATPYTRQAPSNGGPDALDQASAAARAAVQRDCPRHPDRITVADEPAPGAGRNGRFRLWGRAKAVPAA